MASTAARDGSLRLAGMRVLVVEDGWQVAEALKLALELVGMVVAGPVATAREAQRLATACPPDLAVVDVNLKGEMAFPLMDWLQERGIQVVVITGYEDLPRSLDKFAAVLHKPFTAATLLKTLQRVVQQQRPPATP
jgi:DNA-binding response OmpR family regulator